MKVKLTFYFYRAFAVLVVVLGSMFSIERGDFSERVTIVNAILGASGVVVTVFGIWIAIIFPRFVASLGEGVDLESNPDASRYQTLMKSIYRSAFVLACSLLVLMLISIFWVSSPIGKAFFFAYAALSCVSLGECLFASIVDGELTASDAINNGVFVGVVRRRRRKT